VVVKMRNKLFLFKICINKICKRRVVLQNKIIKLKKQHGKQHVRSVEKCMNKFMVHLFNPYILDLKKFKKPINLEYHIRCREIFQKCFKELDIIELKIKQISL